jgi:hypothetical protein
MSHRPWPPAPINPITTRSLGAALCARAELKKYGATSAPPKAPAECPKNSRRDDLLDLRMRFASSMKSASIFAPPSEAPL